MNSIGDSIYRVHWRKFSTCDDLCRRLTCGIASHRKLTCEKLAFLFDQGLIHINAPGDPILFNNKKIIRKNCDVCNYKQTHKNMNVFTIFWFQFTNSIYIIDTNTFTSLIQIHLHQWYKSIYIDTNTFTLIQIHLHCYKYIYIDTNTFTLIQIQIHKVIIDTHTVQH